MTKHILYGGFLGIFCLSTYSVAAQTIERSDFDSEAAYKLHSQDSSFRYCDSNKDGAFQPEELSCYRALLQDTGLLEPAVELASPAAPVMIEAQSLPESALEAARQENECVTTPFLIRRNLDDVGPFSDPTCFADAIGAELAWASDRVVGNDVWTARGLVALPINYEPDFKPGPYVETAVLAPYVYFDRVSNTDKVENDVDLLTYGGVFEFSYANFLDATHYIGIDAEVVSSFSGETKNWTVDLQWEAFGYDNGSLLSALGQPQTVARYFTLTVSPTIQIGYASLVSDVSAQPIFEENDEALRTGPAVLLAIDGIKDVAGTEGIRSWIQKMHFEISYSWLYDILSSRNYELLDTALKFNLDEQGHLGLTLSYRNGELTETGQDIDLAKVALSVSF